MLDLLSFKNVILRVVLSNFNSLMNFHIHTFCHASCSNAIYFTFVVDVNIIQCFLNIHVVTSSFNINM